MEKNSHKHLCTKNISKTSILYYLVLKGSSPLLNSDIFLIFSNYTPEKLIHKIMISILQRVTKVSGSSFTNLSQVTLNASA